LIFAVGTIAGMMLITTIVAVPLTYSANRFQSFNRYVAAGAGAFSLSFGLFLYLSIGFVDFDRNLGAAAGHQCPRLSRNSTNLSWNYVNPQCPTRSVL
jgi:hypothetical protein